MPAPAWPAPSARPAEPAALLPADFRGLIEILERRGEHGFAADLHDRVSLIKYEPPELVIGLTRPLGADWSERLMKALKEVTGTRWRVSLSDESGEPSLLDQEKIAEERVRADVLADPNVRAVMDAFPDSELESFSTKGG